MNSPGRAPEPVAVGAVRITDLQHQIKENESQRTEITSYINQQSIQLHRWKLRLNELNERKEKLQAALTATPGPVEG
jgi:chromosome segregation ATPase